MRAPRRLLVGAGAAAALGAGAAAFLHLRGGLVRRLAPRPGERLLGAGAAAGAIAAEVAERLWPGGELVLLDAPDSAADEAHARGLESVTLAGADAEFADGSFDGAYAIGAADLAEVRRLVRPGGRVVVADRSLRQAGEAAGLTGTRRGVFRA